MSGAMGAKCARCGKEPADGVATIDDERFCHGSDDLDTWAPDDLTQPTCYQRESWSRTLGPAERLLYNIFGDEAYRPDGASS